MLAPRMYHLWWCSRVSNWKHRKSHTSGCSVFTLKLITSFSFKIVSHVLKNYMLNYFTPRDSNHWVHHMKNMHLYVCKYKCLCLYDANIILLYYNYYFILCTRKAACLSFDTERTQRKDKWVSFVKMFSEFVCGPSTFKNKLSCWGTILKY